jgi:transposase
MITLSPNARVYIACGFTDMRKGFDGLVAVVERALTMDARGGALFVFRGKRGDLIKALWWDGQGLVLYAKRLERGRFTWPQASLGKITLTAAQLSMLLEGIDWRLPLWSVRPEPDLTPDLEMPDPVMTGSDAPELPLVLMPKTPAAN